MATDSENRHYDTAADDTSAFDELAARAGAAVRRPAPEHGAAEAVRRGQHRRVATALAAGGVTIVLVSVGVALLRVGTSPEPTTPVATTTVDNGVDSATARAALISVDQIECQLKDKEVGGNKLAAVMQIHLFVTGTAP